MALGVGKIILCPGRGIRSKNEIKHGLGLSKRRCLGNNGIPYGRLGMVSERQGRHTERAIKGEIRHRLQAAKQRRRASDMTQGRRLFALTAAP